MPIGADNLFEDVAGLTVSVDITNTGPVAGKEIVQVYVHDHESRLVRPPVFLRICRSASITSLESLVKGCTTLSDRL